MRGARYSTLWITIPLLALLVAPAAFGQLTGPRPGPMERVGPNAAHGFPAWYQDSTGLTVDFCTPLTPQELIDGWCLILPADVPSGSAPEIWPTNFSEEHFYWSAGANLPYTAAGVNSSAILTLALEAAFATGAPIAGDQLVFGRIRISVRNLPYPGKYTVYHPFGVEVFDNQAAGDRIFWTSDIGINCAAGSFDCALASPVRFLLASGTPGGEEQAPVVGPSGRYHVADPARVGPVTGSPRSPFTVTNASCPDAGQTKDHNIFRIEGPNAFCIETTDFALTGRFVTTALPGKVTVDRASYTRPAAGASHLDVFATAYAAAQPRLPAQPVPQAIAPVLSFWPVDCGVDANGNLISPGVPGFQMYGADSEYWGQTSIIAVPGAVCVEDETARDAAGQVVPLFMRHPVTDEVSVTANYDPGTATLAVTAASSDQVTTPAPTLTLVGRELPLTGGQVTVSPLIAPPATVRVRSSQGGVGDAEVKVGVGAGGGGGLPVAVNDDAPALNEDCSATPSAVPCPAGSGVIIDVLGNDTINRAPIDPATAAITIVVAPRLGTAFVNAGTGTITYTPNLDANGAEGIGYTVTVGTLTSAAAYVSIPITSINDTPTAVNDTVSTGANVSTQINPLANDTDPDGPANLASVQIVSGPTVPAGAPPPTWSVVGGVLNFNASVTGQYTFTYQAQDAGPLPLLLSNTATITVNVGAPESLRVTVAEYRRDQQRWRIAGTSSLALGQTITIVYVDGIATSGSTAGYIVGTAVVDAAGSWAYDTRPITGLANPRDPSYSSPPTMIRVTSSASSAVVDNFVFKVR